MEEIYGGPGHYGVEGGSCWSRVGFMWRCIRVAGGSRAGKRNPISAIPTTRFRHNSDTGHDNSLGMGRLSVVENNFEVDLGFILGFILAQRGSLFVNVLCSFCSPAHQPATNPAAKTPNHTTPNPSKREIYKSTS